jgi:glutamine synthetase
MGETDRWSPGSVLPSLDPAGPANGDELVDAVRRDDIEFVLAMFVEMHGKPCAKLIPASAVPDLCRKGAGFAGFAAGPIGQSPADPDLVVFADPASYTTLPWRPGLAVVQCDPTVNGEAWGYAPRLILKRQLRRLAERGQMLMAGAECEYMLVHRSGTGEVDLADPLDRAPLPCYDARDLLRAMPHLASVARHLQALGWENYANDHEDANGQFEQNFRYADALTTADRVVLFRYMVHTLAEESGMQATFMPKPFSNLTGNGMHLHLSLWSDDGTPMFVDDGDTRGLGLSDVAYHFVGGLIDHAQAWIAVTCPTVNSYKRMGVPAPDSGATWAPAYAAYGGNNRTQLLRVPEPGRVENRGVDGSANPYLALAVLAAAGLDGIDRSLDPGEPNTEDLYALASDTVAARGIRAMPPTLLHAVDQLIADTTLREALGKTDAVGEYIDYYASVKRAEFHQFHTQITPWELDRYLTLA